MVSKGTSLCWGAYWSGFFWIFDRAEIGYGLGIAALDAYHGLTGRQEFEDSLAETLAMFRATYCSKSCTLLTEANGKLLRYPPDMEDRISSTDHWRLRIPR